MMMTTTTSEREREREREREINEQNEYRLCVTIFGFCIWNWGHLQSIIRNHHHLESRFMEICLLKSRLSGIPAIWYFPPSGIAVIWRSDPLQSTPSSAVIVCNNPFLIKDACKRLCQSVCAQACVCACMCMRERVHACVLQQTCRLNILLAATFVVQFVYRVVYFSRQLHAVLFLLLGNCKTKFS